MKPRNFWGIHTQSQRRTIFPLGFYNFMWPYNQFPLYCENSMEIAVKKLKYGNLCLFKVLMIVLKASILDSIIKKYIFVFQWLLC